MTSLAAKVKGLRVAKELSAIRLAKHVPMGRSYLSQIEFGNAPNLGMKILRGLAKALDVRIDYLVDDSSDETRSWRKVASDESLALFLKRNDISEQERSGLRRISFRQSAPRSLEEWHKFWSNMSIYSQPKRRRSSRNRSKSQNNATNTLERQT